MLGLEVSFLESSTAFWKDSDMMGKEVRKLLELLEESSLEKKVRKRRAVGMFVEELNLASPVVRVIAGSWDSMEGLRGQVALSDVVICHWLLWGTFPTFLK